MHNHVLDCLLSNNVLSSHQFGFRPDSSTQEALLYAMNEWRVHLDKRFSVAALSYDLSEAFDKVPHCKLVSDFVIIIWSSPKMAL